jgi:hypothetical protein
MTKFVRKSEINYAISKGSILLLFDEIDAKIVRGWLLSADSKYEIDKHEPDEPSNRAQL